MHRWMDRQGRLLSFVDHPSSERLSAVVAPTWVGQRPESTTRADARIAYLLIAKVSHRLDHGTVPVTSSVAERRVHSAAILLNVYSSV